MLLTTALLLRPSPTLLLRRCTPHLAISAAARLMSSPPPGTGTAAPLIERFARLGQSSSSTGSEGAPSEVPSSAGAMMSRDPSAYTAESTASTSTTSLATPSLRYITASEAASLDEELMSPRSRGGCGYSLPQLMELAGLACAQALARCYPPTSYPELLVAAGPGNQGGDGLVAARHAKLWGYRVKVWYPKQGKEEHFQNLRDQLESFDVDFVDADDFDDAFAAADVVLDSIFGFSFKGPPRPPFASALETLRHESRLEFVDRVTRPPVVSVDVPSGWPVDEDTSSSPPTPELTFHPDVLISLTAPKTGVRRFQRTTGQRGGGGQVQRHFLGGRFVPPRVARKFGLKGMLQGGFDFRRAGDSQIVEVTNWREAEDGEETEDSEYEEYDEEEGEGEEQHEGRR